jgi:hypothetical protein
VPPIPQNPGSFGPDNPNLTPSLDPQTLAEWRKKFEQPIVQDPKQLLKEGLEALAPFEQALRVKRQLVEIDERANRVIEDRRRIEAEVDRDLAKRPKMLQKELESRRMLVGETKELLDLRQKEGLEAAKSSKVYDQAREKIIADREAQEAMVARSTGRSGGGAGGAAAGGLLGGIMAGHGVHGGLIDFAKSYLPGGASPHEAIRGRILDRFPNMNERAATGLARTAATAGGLMALVRAGPLLYAQIANLGLNQVRGRLIGAEQMGQQVGGGIGAGVHMQRRAAQLGMNPFDAISSQIAQEIVQGVVQAGFKGKLADNMEGAVKSIYIGTGMQIPEIVQLLTLGMRNMGISLKEATSEIKSFHDSVKDTNMSMTEYSQRVASLSTFAAGQGAGTHSIRIGRALTNAFQGLWSPDQIQQVMGNQQMQAQMAGQLGVMPQMLMNEGLVPAPRMLAAFGNVIKQQRGLAERQARGMLAQQGVMDPSPDRLRKVEAGVLSTLLPGPLQGMPADSIEDLLRRMDSNRGPTAQANLMGIHERFIQGRQAAVRGGQFVTKADLNRARREDVMAGATHNEDAIRRRAFKNRYGIDIQGGSGDFMTIDGKQYYVPDLPKAITHDHKLQHMAGRTVGERLYNRRLDSLDKLTRGNLIGAKETQRLISHISDRSFNWQGELEKIGAMRPSRARHKGYSVDVETNAGTVVIKLDPSTRSLILDSDSQRKRAANYGKGRTNDIQPHESVKTAGENRGTYSGSTFGG